MPCCFTVISVGAVSALMLHGMMHLGCHRAMLIHSSMRVAAVRHLVNRIIVRSVSEQR